MTQFSGTKHFFAIVKKEKLHGKALICKSHLYTALHFVYVTSMDTYNLNLHLFTVWIYYCLK